MFDSKNDDIFILVSHKDLTFFLDIHDWLIFNFVELWKESPSSDDQQFVMIIFTE